MDKSAPIFVFLGLILGLSVGCTKKDESDASLYLKGKLDLSPGSPYMEQQIDRTVFFSSFAGAVITTSLGDDDTFSLLVEDIALADYFLASVRSGGVPVLRAIIDNPGKITIGLTSEASFQIISTFVLPFGKRIKSFVKDDIAAGYELNRILISFIERKTNEGDQTVGRVLDRVIYEDEQVDQELVALLHPFVILSQDELKDQFARLFSKLPLDPDQYIELFEAGLISDIELIESTSTARGNDPELDRSIRQLIEGAGDSAIIADDDLLSCWDTDLNGINDLSEDRNIDGIWDEYDCVDIISNGSSTDEGSNQVEQIDKEDPGGPDRTDSTAPTEDADRSDGTTSAGADDPLVLGETPVKIAQENLPYDYRFKVVAKNNEVLTFTLVRGPTFLQLENDRLYGTPSTADIGTHRVIVVVTDLSGGALSIPFDLRVISYNTPPRLLNNCLTTAIKGFLYLCNLDASDDNDETVTFSLMTGPAEMVVSTDGSISWNPPGTALDQSFPLQIEYSDGVNDEIYSFVLNVIASLGDSRIITELGKEILEDNLASDLATQLMYGIGSAYSIAIDSEVTSFGICAVAKTSSGGFADDLDIHSVLDPSDILLIDPDPEIDPIGKTNVREPGQSTIALVLPNNDRGDNPSYPLIPGNYQVRIQNIGNEVEATLYSVVKRDSDIATGTLSLNVFLVGANLADGNYAKLTEDGPGPSILSKINTIYNTIGITVNIAMVVELDDLAEFSESSITIDTGSINPIFEAKMARLFEQSSRGNPNAVSIFLIENVEDYSSDGGSILGYAADIPGSLISGTSASGVIISTSYRTIGTMSEGDKDQVSFTIAHELGHYLGLYHTSDSIEEHDPLSDTPECTIDTGAFGLDRSDCLDLDATNLMFFLPSMSYDNIALTDQQTYILQVNPWVR